MPAAIRSLLPEIAAREMVQKKRPARSCLAGPRSSAGGTSKAGAETLTVAKFIAKTVPDPVFRHFCHRDAHLPRKLCLLIVQRSTKMHKKPAMLRRLTFDASEKAIVRRSIVVGADAQFH
ncbi:hypothetical protein GVO57_01185 [Sphingomonas changnyeongensis]|uniref:Uncharacterized protein n=1 Tax=Sphingomonas changnyeongensis TaxID=2698679 RepID=A0A7Z2NTR0_9SPHN|nr:hypothetical protein [Sphingomonas changnyeongensis]QHL89690.1 hypothetical protein GVO57_01185 [Sphingomonas changnyeongensis]